MTNLDYDVPWLIIPESWKHPKAKAGKPSASRTKREPAKWRAMTDLEIEAATQLGQCRMPPATGAKRLARHMAAQAKANDPKITDKQAEYLWKFCWRYRRQISSATVAREAKRQRKLAEVCA